MVYRRVRSEKCQEEREKRDRYVAMRQFTSVTVHGHRRGRRTTVDKGTLVASRAPRKGRTCRGMIRHDTYLTEMTSTQTTTQPPEPPVNSCRLNRFYLGRTGTDYLTSEVKTNRNPPRAPPTSCLPISHTSNWARTEKGGLGV